MTRAFLLSTNIEGGEPVDYFYTNKDSIKQIGEEDQVNHATVFVSRNHPYLAKSMDDALDNYKIVKPKGLKVRPFREIDFKHGDWIETKQGYRMLVTDSPANGDQLQISSMDNEVKDSIKVIYRRSDSEIIVNEAVSVNMRKALLFNGYSPVYAFENMRYTFKEGWNNVYVKVCPQNNNVTVYTKESITIEYWASIVAFAISDIKKIEEHLQSPMDLEIVPCVIGDDRVEIVWSESSKTSIFKHNGGQLLDPVLSCSLKVAASIVATLKSSQELLPTKPVRQTVNIIRNKMFEQFI